MGNKRLRPKRSVKRLLVGELRELRKLLHGESPLTGALNPDVPQVPRPKRRRYELG